MTVVTPFEEIFDASKIDNAKMNVPRILSWLNEPSPVAEDPFNPPKIGELIAEHGLDSIRKIPRINEHSSRKEPPFYGAQFILKNEDKFRVSYEIDLWITYESLVAAFGTEDSTTATSRYHEELLFAQYQFDQNQGGVDKLVFDMNKRLNEVPLEVRASIRNKYREKIEDAKLLQMQLKTALDQARSRYSQSTELDAQEDQEDQEDQESYASTGK